MNNDNNYKIEVLKRKIKAIEWQRKRFLILRKIGLILITLSLLIVIIGLLSNINLCIISGLVLVIVSYVISNGINNKFETGNFWNNTLEKNNNSYQEPSWNDQLRIIEKEINNSYNELNELMNKKDI